MVSPDSTNKFEISRLVASVVAVLTLGVSVPDTEAIASMSPTPSGTLLATQQTPRNPKNWKNAQLVRTLPGTPQRIAISPDGLLLAGAEAQSIKLWNISTGEEVRTFPAFPDNSAEAMIQWIAFSPDGKRLAASSYSPDQNTLLVKLWDVNTGQEIRTLKSALVPTIQWSYFVFRPDSQMLALVTGGNPAIELWDVNTGIIRRTIRGGEGTVVFSPDGQRIARSSENSINLWDVSTGRTIRTLRGKLLFNKLAFNSDGNTLICEVRLHSGNAFKAIQTWDLRTGKLLRTMGNFHWSTQTVFSPNGLILAGGSPYSSVFLFDVTQGQVVFGVDEYLGHGSVPIFSLDGQTLAYTNDGQIKIWR